MSIVSFDILVKFRQVLAPFSGSFIVDFEYSLFIYLFIYLFICNFYFFKLNIYVIKSSEISHIWPQFVANI